MKQQSLAASGFEANRKKIRKEIFLEEMEQVIPWLEMSEAIKPCFPKPMKSMGFFFGESIG